MTACIADCRASVTPAGTAAWHRAGHAPRRFGAVPPRVILLWVILLIVFAALMHAVAPWILPARIIEGPLVQAVGPRSATLVWYLTRPARCDVVVTIDGEGRGYPVHSAGRRCVAHLDGLEPGSVYPYQIRTGQRLLTRDLSLRTGAPAGQRFTFLVFGDSGMGSRAQYLLAREMLASQPPPDFILHTGDIVYPAGERTLYEERFFAPYRALLASIPLWPCLGNHDVRSDGAAPAYEEVFVVPDNGPAGLPPKHNYWFNHASCRVAVIDSNADEKTLRAHVAPWILSVMSPRDARWKFVALHHPPYTAGKYPPDATIQDTLVPVFEEAGVDVVFSGHDHNYQRTHPLRAGQVVQPGDGIAYIVTGAGGAKLYDLRPPDQRPSWIAAADDQHHSFTQVTVEDGQLTVRQIARGGSILDEFVLRKETAPGTQTAP